MKASRIPVRKDYQRRCPDDDCARSRELAKDRPTDGSGPFALGTNDCSDCERCWRRADKMKEACVCVGRSAEATRERLRAAESEEAGEQQLSGRSSVNKLSLYSLHDAYKQTPVDVNTARQSQTHQQRPGLHWLSL